MKQETYSLQKEPDLNDVLIFAQFRSHHTLTQVASALDIPKSTVSRRLAALEQALGVELISRSTRHVELTEAGKEYLVYAESIADLSQDAYQHIQGYASSPKGRLRVSMPPDISSLGISSVLADFIRQYPDIHLEADLRADYVDLIAERFDCVLRVGSVLKDANLVARPLCQIPVKIFANVALIRRYGPINDLESLQKLPFVSLSQLQQEQQGVLLQHEDEQVRLNLRYVASSNNIGLLGDFVKQGIGAAFLHRGLVEDALASGEVIEILPDYYVEGPQIWLLTVQRKLLPRKTQVFIDHLRAAFNQ